MNSKILHSTELDRFISPFIDDPAWGAKQGFGSFLTFEFGQPELKIEERQIHKRGLKRSAYVQGEWHFWIYCCNWRFFLDDEKNGFERGRQRTNLSRHRYD